MADCLEDRREVNVNCLFLSGVLKVESKEASLLSLDLFAGLLNAELSLLAPGLICKARVV